VLFARPNPPRALTFISPAFLRRPMAGSPRAKKKTAASGSRALGCVTDGFAAEKSLHTSRDREIGEPILVREQLPRRGRDRRAIRSRRGSTIDPGPVSGGALRPSSNKSRMIRRFPLLAFLRYGAAASLFCETKGQAVPLV